MIKQSTVSLQASLFAAFTVLFGCGGGGGDANSTSNTPQSATSASPSGTKSVNVVDLSNADTVAKLASVVLSAPEVLPDAYSYSVGALHDQFGISTSSKRSSACPSGGTSTKTTDNPDGKPSLNDSVSTTFLNCAYGKAGVDYLKSTGTNTVTITNISNYAYASTGTWSAQLSTIAPRIEMSSDLIDASGAKAVSSGVGDWNISRKLSFNGANTTTTTDDTLQSVTNGTINANGVLNGSVEAQSVTVATNCTSNNPATYLNTVICSSGSVRLVGELVASGFGSVDISAANSGNYTITATASGVDFVQGRFNVTVGSSNIVVDFVGNAASPQVKITSPNGSSQTIPMSKFRVSK